MCMIAPTSQLRQYSLVIFFRFVQVPGHISWPRGQASKGRENADLSLNPVHVMDRT